MAAKGLRPIVWFVGLVALVTIAAAVYFMQSRQDAAYEAVKQPAGSIDVEGNVMIDPSERPTGGPRRVGAPTSQETSADPVPKAK